LGRFRCVLSAAVATLLLAAAPAALPAPSPAAAPLPPKSAPVIQAHPALWTVHGPKATAYLLGSIHVLPPQMEWTTAQIDAALKAADTFVFEIPMDPSQKTDIQEFIAKNGFLPQGTALPSLLTPEARKDYAAALNLTHVPADKLTPMRPWLALLVLEGGMVTQQHFSADSGIDRQVYALVQKRPGVTFRSFETAEQQLKLLMPADQSLEIQEFDAGLKDILHETMSIDDLIDAWAKGDVAKLNGLMNIGFKENPRAEKALFEDRNRAWVSQLQAMLNEKHVYFITVGTGHLVGPKGLPSLLREQGYKVHGP
jgi:uncharacterized protein YbaP (TraB family)